jgi:hypothetical protein
VNRALAVLGAVFLVGVALAWAAHSFGYWFAPTYPVAVSIEQLSAFETDSTFSCNSSPGGCTGVVTSEQLVDRCVPRDDREPLFDAKGPVGGRYLRTRTMCRSESAPYFGREQSGAWVASRLIGEGRFHYTIVAAFATYGACWYAAQGRFHSATEASLNCTYLSEVRREAPSTVHSSSDRHSLAEDLGIKSDDGAPSNRDAGR